jgi:hypothetical protein
MRVEYGPARDNAKEIRAGGRRTSVGIDRTVSETKEGLAQGAYDYQAIAGTKAQPQILIAVNNPHFERGVMGLYLGDAGTIIDRHGRAPPRVGRRGRRLCEATRGDECNDPDAPAHTFMVPKGRDLMHTLGVLPTDSSVASTAGPLWLNGD